MLTVTFPTEFSLIFSIMIVNLLLNVKIKNPNMDTIVPTMFPRFITPKNIGLINKNIKAKNIIQKHTLKGVLSI